MRILAAAVIYLFTISQVFAACTMPTSVANEVGRGQTYSSAMANITLLGGGARHWLWSNNATDTVTTPAGVSVGQYVPTFRTPSAQGGSYAGKAIDWYRDPLQGNHPTWIVYRPDHKTPAWQFFCRDPLPPYDLLDMTDANCDGDDQTALAIWDSNVQSFIEGADVLWASTTGYFKNISADNADWENKWFKAGTCDVVPTTLRCEDTVKSAGPPIVYGTWTSRYDEAYAVAAAPAGIGATSITVGTGQGTAFIHGMQLQIRNSTGKVIYKGHNVATGGTSNTVSPGTLDVAISTGDVLEATTLDDSAHGADLVTWLGLLRTYANSVNLCLVANMTWHSTARAGWLASAAKVDIIYEEAGFNGTSETSDVPGDGEWQDSNWINKVADYQTALATVGGAQGFAHGASNSSNYANRQPRIDYGVASALLFKGSYAYPAITANGHSVSMEEYEPNSYWAHGAPSGAMALTSGVYNRTFANGLVLVNPSSTDTVSYDLSTTVYHTTNGLRYTGVVTMAPLSSYILHSSAPSGGFVLTH